ncbi:MAG: GspE/PulE family protein [Patescibacteria group bacterium]|jgi:type IV pilus assembly protein PilB
MSDETQHKAYSISTPEKEEKLSEKMEEIRIKEKEQEAKAKAADFGLPYINLKGFPIAPEILSAITKEQALEAQIVPFFKHEGEVRVGVLDPFVQKTIATIQTLQEQQKANVLPYIISDPSFAHAIKLYDMIPRPRHYVSGVRIEATDLKQYRAQVTNLQSLGKLISSVPFAELVTVVVAGALETRSSDIHVEAEVDDVKVRYRIDGVLHDVASLKREVWKQLINRLKLIAKVKLNIATTPQDGRFTIHLPEEEIDVRASFLPTGYGESVVMRILRSSAAALDIEELGLRGQALEIVRREIRRPNGMLLTTGPTGSGKTTTLYAMLHAINSPEKKIITLENPIEYRLKGVNQSQVNDAGGYSFAKGLRSIMRQDPDIVMVGEIRDEETAEIAVNAALTGHFVLSTLHTNNAAGAIPRFIAMQVKPYLLAPALNTVIAQRLVRRMCQYCKHETKLPDDIMQKVRSLLDLISPKAGVTKDLTSPVFYESKGCDKCQGIGYKGRIGLYEIFSMNPEIEKMMIDNRVSEYEMQRVAIENGMLSMAQDGLLKAMDGITTAEEVLKVANI